MNQEELKELVAYEVFFLIEAYEIIQHPLSGRYEETLEFPHDGSDSRRTAHAYVSMMTGDWRSGFLRAGGPLILASSFKIFDLIVEWILGDDSRTGKGGALQFKQKVTLLNKPTRIWPVFLQTESPIRERFVALYEALFPYRNTIIHASRFKRTNGGVEVAPSEGKGAFGDPLIMDVRFLTHIANTAVLLARILEGTWQADLYTTHRLRWSLNLLRSLHKVPADSYIKPPSLALVRIHRDEASFIHFHVEKIALELNQPMMVPTDKYGEVDMRRTHALFDLEIFVTHTSGEKSRYLVPFTSVSLLQNGLPMERLAEFRVSLTNAA